MQTIGEKLNSISVTIHGQPPSKSNAYKIISRPAYLNKKGDEMISPHASLGKTPKLKKYEQLFLLQLPPEMRGLKIEKTMRVEIDCYYRSMQPDLDNSAKIILDCLQNGRVIKNDNRVIELFMKKFVDKNDPRAEIKITPLGI